MSLNWWISIAGLGLMTVSSALGQEQEQGADELAEISGGELEFFEQGRELAAQGELMKSLPLLRRAADGGGVDAQQLCAMVLVKLNRPELFEEAKSRLADAAENGSVVALEEQGRLALVGGLGEQLDFGRARNLLEAAIEQPGASESFYLLGRMAAEGLGRDQDLALAVSFMRRGEKAGSSSAILALGQLYLGEGSLIERDLSKAEALFLRAFEQKRGEAAFYLGLMAECYHRDSPRWEEAVEWYRKAGKFGFAAAFKKLGDLALQEQVEQEEAAFNYYQVAVGLKNVEAAYALAGLYQSGRTVPQDMVAAAAWVRFAAERDHLPAQNQLGLWLLEGQGGRPDFEEAMAWLEKDAVQGYPAAQYNLAVVMLETKGPEEKHAQAIELLKKAGKGRHREAASRLAVLYDTGEFVVADSFEAAFWAGLAAKEDGGEELEKLARDLASKLDSMERDKLAKQLGEE